MFIHVYKLKQYGEGEEQKPSRNHELQGSTEMPSPNLLFHREGNEIKARCGGLDFTIPILL